MGPCSAYPYFVGHLQLRLLDTVARFQSVPFKGFLHLCGVVFLSAVGFLLLFHILSDQKGIEGTQRVKGLNENGSD